MSLSSRHGTCFTQVFGKHLECVWCWPEASNPSVTPAEGTVLRIYRTWPYLVQWERLRSISQPYGRILPSVRECPGHLDELCPGSLKTSLTWFSTQLRKLWQRLPDQASSHRGLCSYFLQDYNFQLPNMTIFYNLRKVIGCVSCAYFSDNHSRLLWSTL